MTIIDAALNRSRTVIGLLFLLLAVGLVTYIEIPKESRPDISVPSIYVSLHLKGISPQDADRLLVRPMESELRTIGGIKELRSSAYQGGANITLDFEAGTDLDQALNDVRERVDLGKAKLPSETEEPRVHEINLSLLPVLIVTLGGDVPERTLLKLTRNLRTLVEGIPGVLEAKISGSRDELLEIIADPLILESYKLDLQTIYNAVDRANRIIPSGSLTGDKGSFPVKLSSVFENAEDILGLPLVASGDSVVTLKDVASVRRTFADRTSFARLNGKPALALEVKKRTGENIIETVDAVKDVVDEARKQWPPGILVNYSNDESESIRSMLSDLQNSVTTAVLLVMIIIVGALGFRTGLLVGVAIPGSFLTGILVLAGAGLTVNVVVLFSLILAVGLLVDGAIVVTEYADRKMIEGASRATAYAEAARRMAWPIITSTSTTLAAFLPLLFWPGLIGEFMRYLPITLIATLSASLAMALIFVPTLGAKLGRPGASNATTISQMTIMESGDIRKASGFTGLYIRILERALRHPVLIAITAVAMLGSAWALYASHGKGFEFFPEVEPDRAVLKVFARGNLSVVEVDELIRQVENEILDIQRERGEIRSLYVRSGKNPNPEEIGRINIQFTDWNTRRTADEILKDIIKRTDRFGGVRIETAKERAGPLRGKPIQIRVSSRDPDLIPPAIATIRGKLETIEGLKDIEDNRPVPGVEWQLRVDHRQAAKFGADTALIGNIVRLVTNGLDIGDYRPDDTDEEISIAVRFPKDKRTLKQIDSIKIQTAFGHVPLSNFLTREAKPRTSTLRRTNSLRTMAVQSDVMPGVLTDDLVAQIRDWLGTEAVFDPGLNISFHGEDKEQKEASQFLARAFAIALFLMTIILVTQFNRFYSAFLILSAVVMSTVGVMLGLLVIQQPFGIVMSGIGVIALAGIVVNNNIVLIDTYDRLAKTSATPMEAILRTGAQRLRPVLLTTITTILGLLPMVMRINVDLVTREVTSGAPSTQWWQQLSSTIAFGLAFATILTLIVTPALLMIRSNVVAWKTGRRARRRAFAISTSRPAETPGGVT